MSRIMCLEQCPFKTKTGYCRYSYCDEKAFFLYKDFKYLMIKSGKDVVDRKKVFEFIDAHIQNPEASESVVLILNVLKKMIMDGRFDVNIKEKENRYAKESIEVRKVAEGIFDLLSYWGLCHCSKEAHMVGLYDMIEEWREKYK